MTDEKPRILSVTAAHVAELHAENAKLRELASYLHELLSCAYGAAYPDGMPAVLDDSYQAATERMRELGIGVDA